MSTYKARKNAATKNKSSYAKLLSTSAMVAVGLASLTCGSANAGIVEENEVWQFADGTDVNETMLDIGHVQFSDTGSGRIIGNLVKEDICATCQVDLNAALTVATGVEAGPMQLLGRLTSTGDVFVFDVNGFLFGANSRVDVVGSAGFIGGTADISITDTGVEFDIDVADDATITIEQGAMISVGEAGLAAFVSPTIVNAGIINAKMGTVVMAAGEAVTLDLYGDGLVEVTVEGELADALIENKGRIEAEGGRVQMTALAAKDVVDNIINIEGVITVASAEVQGGKIVLFGGDSGVVSIAGTLDASGTTGGDIHVTGETIRIADSGQIMNDGDNSNTYFYGTEKAITRGKIKAHGDNALVEFSGAEVDIDDSVFDVSGTDAKVVIDPVTFTVTLANVGTIVAGLLGADWDITAEELITVDTTIDSSAQGNSNTLNFKDEDANNDLQIDLNADIILGNNQSLTGDGTVVNVAGTASIQDGISVASTAVKATVNVASGTYNENVVIDKNLFLIGNTADLDVTGAGAGAPLIQGTGAGIGIDASLASLTDVTISGFAIDNFQLGIGANIGNGTVIDIPRTNVDINNNTITNVSAGIFVDEFADVNVAFNTIDVTGSSSFAYGENTVFNDGIHVEDFSNTTAHVTDNIITNSAGTGNDGISVEDVFHNDTMTVFIERNEISGFQGATSAGIDIKDAATVTIQNNIVTDNTIGIELDGLVDGDDVKIFGNDLSGNVGLALANNSGSGTVDASGNWWGTADEDAVLLAAPGGAVDVTPFLMLGTDTDGAATGFQGDFSKLFVTALGEQVQTGGRINEAVGLVADGSLIGGNREIHVGEGTFIESVLVNTAVKLLGIQHGVDARGRNNGPESIVQPNSPGFHVDADDVTIDGFTIAGDGTDDGIIVSNQANTKILNNIINNTTVAVNATVTGATIDQNQIDTTTGDGVFVSGGTNNKVTNNDIGVNGAAGSIGEDGINYFGSTNGVITGNTVEDTTRHGIFASNDSNGALINDNEISRAGHHGVSVTGSSNMTVTNNTIDTTGVVTPGGEGINAVGISGTNLIDTNDVSNTSGSGIDIINSSGVTVSNNTTDNTGTLGQNTMHGIRLFNSGGTIVDTNTVNNTNNGDGIHAQGSSFVQVINNLIGLLGGANNIGQDGIHINGSNNALVQNNTIQDTAANGVLVNPSSNVTVDGNTIDNVDGHGIRVDSSNGTEVKNNLIGQNGGADNIRNNGINVFGSETTIVDNNTVDNTELGGGIHAVGSVGIQVTNNLVGQNGGAGNINTDGIHVRTSASSTVSGNTVDNTGGDGIEVESSDGVDAATGVQVTGNFVGTNGGTDNIGVNGIYINDSDWANVDGNEVEETQGQGILVNPSSNVVIAENDVFYTALNGIKIIGGSNNTIRDNNVAFTGDDGIDVEDTSQIRIHGNLVGFTGDDGIDSDNSSHVYIYDNVVGITGLDDEDGDGIDVHGGSYVEIYGNKIALTRRDGIHVGDVEYNEDYTGDEGYGTQVDIHNNDVALTGRHGIYVHDSGKTRIADNDVLIAGLNFDGIFGALIGGDVIGEDYITIPWGDGDGIRVKNVHAFNSYDRAVDITGNDVAWTGGHGINVFESGNTRIANNYVEYAGIDSTSWSFDSLEDHFGSLDFEAVKLAGLNVIFGDGDLTDFVSNLIPHPTHVAFDDASEEGNAHDGIHVEWVQGDIHEDKDPDGDYSKAENDDWEGDHDYPRYNVEIVGNEVDYTADDGIEGVGNGTTLVDDNDVNYAGVSEVNQVESDDNEERAKIATLSGDDHGDYNYVLGNGDYYGADGIHIRNSGGYGPEVTWNIDTEEQPNPESIQDYEGDHHDDDHFMFTGDTHFGVVITNNRVNKTADDGIEVVGQEFLLANLEADPQDDVKSHPIFSGGSVLIDYNHVDNAGFGNAGPYGEHAPDGYGADGIHVRNVGLIQQPVFKVVDGPQGPYDAPTWYSVVVTNNMIDTVGDDGIEVLNSGRTLIGGNRISYVGLDSYRYDGSYGTYFNDGDGIHVENVFEFGGIPPWATLVDVQGSSGPYDGPVDEHYSVEIYDNYIHQTGDDGIEVLDSGRTIIAGNDIMEAGVGEDAPDDDGHYYRYGYGDYYGADGIHVRGVRNQNGGVWLPVAGAYSDGAGTYYGGYAVNILDNYIDATGDDGVEVANSGSTLVAGNHINNVGVSGRGVNPELTKDVKVQNDGYYGSGGGAFDGYGADAIHVRDVHNGSGLISAGPTDSYGGHQEYAVVVRDNHINNASDDGIEVLRSGRTLIDSNHIYNVGLYGYHDVKFGGGRNNYNGGEDRLFHFSGEDYYGGDAIHVREVHADNNISRLALSVQDGGSDPYDGYYGYGYSVEILNNLHIDGTSDDGVEVVYSGNTRIDNNDIKNVGVNEADYRNNGFKQKRDRWGADGIHVRDVLGNIRRGDTVQVGIALPGFAVEVTNNMIDNTADDGIQVLWSGNTLVDHNMITRVGDVVEAIEDEYEGYYGYRYEGPLQDDHGADGIHVHTGLFADGLPGTNPSNDAYFLRTYVEITNNTIGKLNPDGSTSEGASDDGIETEGITDLLVDGNHVYDSGDDGIRVLGYAGFFAEHHDDNIEKVSLIETGGNGYYGFVPEFNVVISNNEVIDSGTPEMMGHEGHEGHDGYYGYSPAHGDGIEVTGYDRIAVLENEVSNSVKNGLFLSGPFNARFDSNVEEDLDEDSYKAVVSGNTFTNNDIGANFESGLIDLTGDTNEFIGGRVGLRFAPFHFDREGGYVTPRDFGGWVGKELITHLPYYGYANLALIDDDGPGSTPFPAIPGNFGGTIGSQFFDGQSDFFVELDNHAFFDMENERPIWQNGLNSTYVTPFGTVTPSVTGGVVAPDVFAFLEEKFFHYPDRDDVGIFFFGVPGTLAGVDQERIFNEFGEFGPGFSGLNVTVTGLPPIQVLPFNPAGIEPAAGGEGEEEDVANVEPEAGGADVACWNQGLNAGGTFSYGFTGDPEENLADADACGTSDL